MKALDHCHLEELLVGFGGLRIFLSLVTEEWLRNAAGASSGHKGELTFCG
jgi:hypothetical protein